MSLQQNPKKEKLSDELQETIKEWFQSVGIEGEIIAKVSRLWPEMSDDGTPIKGYLGEVDMATLDEDYIKRKWGGGRFQLRLINTADGQYVKSKNIQIAGEPKTANGKSNGEPASIPVGPSDSLQARAMDIAERNSEREREARAKMEERLWEKQERPAYDPALEILKGQLSAQTDEMRELRRQ